MLRAIQITLFTSAAVFSLLWLITAVSGESNRYGFFLGIAFLLWIVGLACGGADPRPR